MNRVAMRDGGGLADGRRAAFRPHPVLAPAVAEGGGRGMLAACRGRDQGCGEVSAVFRGVPLRRWGWGPGHAVGPGGRPPVCGGAGGLDLVRAAVQNWGEPGRTAKPRRVAWGFVRRRSRRPRLRWRGGRLAFWAGQVVGQRRILPAATVAMTP